MGSQHSQIGLNQIEKEAAALASGKTLLTEGQPSNGKPAIRQNQSPRHIAKRRALDDDNSDNCDIITEPDGGKLVKRSGSEQSLNFGKADMKS